MNVDTNQFLDTLILWTRRLVSDIFDRFLDKVETEQGMAEAMRTLHRHQCKVGFVKQREFRRLALVNGGRRYLIQINKGRAERLAKSPPSNDQEPACVLDWPTIETRSATQLRYRYKLCDDTFFALCNPYPLGRFHLTHAGRHEPQHWVLRHSSEESVNSLLRVVDRILELAERLPDVMVFHNGVDAGSSIKEHFHFQSLERPDEVSEWALEAATAARLLEARDASPLLLRQYPLPVVVFRGSRDELLVQTRGFARQWLSSWPIEHVTANILATSCSQTKGLRLYIVPRDRRYKHSSKMCGEIGALECLGEFVFSHDTEITEAEGGRVTAVDLESILAAVDSPGLRSLLDNIFLGGLEQS